LGIISLWLNFSRCNLKIRVIEFIFWILITSIRKKQKSNKNMKRVYKFWVNVRNLPHLIRYLTFACEIKDYDGSLSNIFDGHIVFKKNGSIVIYDWEPEIIQEETSEDWEEHIKFKHGGYVTTLRPLKAQDLHFKVFMIDEKKEDKKKKKR